MSNAKQKEKVPWKLLLFFFSLSIIKGSLTQYYVRKLFTKCLGFQIDRFFFIPIYTYICTVAEFKQMLHFGLEWLGNVCESTFGGTKMSRQYTQVLFVKKIT